ncbi:MAG TPA: hypothetical protein VGO59_17550 [Verrucomicrobiae bacterium]
MKRFIATAFLGLGLCQAAFAGKTAPITPEFYNYGFLTNTPTVDAYSFYNAGQIEIDAVTSFNTSNSTGTLALNGFNPLPFSTKDTLNYTNAASGLMLALPGFRFDTATSTTRHSANSFLNMGRVQGVDFPAVAAEGLVGVPGSTAFFIVPALAQPVPSQVTVMATNIINQGTIQVGDDGVVNLAGKNVTNRFAAIAAGFLDTDGLTNADTDLTGIQGQEGFENVVNGPFYHVPSLGVYDLFWAITNGLTENVQDFAGGLPYSLPANYSGGARGNNAIFGVPANGNAEFAASAILYAIGTNVYYNLVFVNTNLPTNITATVAFGPAEFLEYASTTTPEDGNAEEAVVQFAEPVFDVITSTTVTNAIYLIDDGAVLPNMAESPDVSAFGPYFRPNAYELTTVTPIDWFVDEIVPFNDGNYVPEAIFQPGVYNNNKVPVNNALYGAQIGRNPSALNGSFSSLDTNIFDINPLTEGDLNVSLLDPTNDPGRIQITANNLDMTQARFRANGMVILNVTNLIGSGTAAVDWGEANANIGVSNGLLTISNIFPTNFQRLRGDIYAMGATWQNTATNDPFFGGTNQWHFHVLVVDQNLFGSFTPVVRNLTLTGKSSVVLQDNLNVINQAVFNTTNLTIASTVSFAQNSKDFVPATTPQLKNLFVAPGGVLVADNMLDVGYNVNNGPIAPGGRTYTVNTITNFGSMISTAPLLQSQIFENDGSISTENNGSILIEASNLYMGLALTNTVNMLNAGGSVDLSAVTIQITNSVINAGLGQPAFLTLEATAELTDGVSGIPTTNTNSVIINHFTVTDGFNLPIKPAIGDLFGTSIHTIAAGQNQFVTHVWAGTDWSNNIARGFTDNAVIGQLILDRQSSNSILHFSAAGVRNAMYVDYLELTNYSTNYRTGFSIDPNFTIYFADSNVDPEKLHEVYPNLVWATNFVGPNSTYVVPYLPAGSGLYCLMNAAVANSTEIAFWPPFVNYDYLTGQANLPGPYPYLLNNPNNPLDIIPCNSPEINGIYSFSCDCTPGTNLTQLLLTNVAGGNLSYNVLTVAHNGNGSIQGIPTQSQLALGNSYTLTAVPATGWVFDSWNTAILGNVITSYSNVLTFVFVSNTVVTANFIPTPFPELLGQYNGLFFETNGIDPDSSGSVSLTMSKTGSFSGKLVMGPNTYTFSSQFTGSGMAQFAAKSRVGTLTVNLQLDVTNLSGDITGDVNGGSWDAALAADLAPVWTVKNPSPLAGAYTMSLPWDAGTDTTNAGGDSFGAGSVSKLGVLTLTGQLADGATFTTAAPVNQYGQWPLYIYSATKKDSVLGWVTVSNVFGGSDNGLSGTNISWVKPPFTGSLYPNGFNNILQLTGSTWVAPARGADALPLSGPAIMLSGGDLSAPLTIPVKIQGVTGFTATNATLTINAAIGAFTGSFTNPDTHKRVTMRGVVLQNANSARGFFLGADESGAVLLGGQ